MKRTLIISLLAMTFGSFAAESQAQADFNVVPRPASVKAVNADDFVLNENTVIVGGKTKAAKQNALFLQQYVKERTGYLLPIVKKAPATNAIVLLCSNNKGLNPEGYELSVSKDCITITGNTDAGTFYGIQTLRKALPHRIVNMNNPRINDAQRRVSIPATIVNDAPRFSYRGAHLDVSRHYVTVDSIHRFIDMLALHNINRFHWHITDDQGWRIEIKKYPRLTQVGSKRTETVIGHNSGKYDGIPYGGFYTQKECKEIVKYAAARNITIIPEIDMPGHMQGALAAYPELGCTGGPYDVWRMWGVSDDVLCAGNDKTLKFIDDVLDEVAKIFPSEYIHVGGDECPKTAWKKCPKCQARIAAEGLEARDGHTAEERLQSYIIRHAEAHLTKLGRKMIGWDETLEGGLAEGATVMSWRGEAGGIEAARQHHDVIMTPNTYLYFDYYQSLDTDKEPDAIGGFLNLERVYGYEPVPDKMLNEGLGKYIVGVQANCWTEYMPTYRQIEYMELPRMAALSEIQWSPRGTKDYDEFCQRTLNLIGLYDEQGYNYAKHIFDPKIRHYADTDKHCIVAELVTNIEAPIHYTLDGTDPTQASPVYEGPIELRENTKLRAATFRPVEARPGSAARRWESSNVQSADFAFNKATASAITLTNDPAPQYTFDGAPALVDGIKAINRNFQSNQWLGFLGKDMEATIDLGAPTEITSVSIDTNVDKGSWIFNCRGLSIEGSNDGKTFTTIASEEYPEDAQSTPDGVRNHTLKFAPVAPRYIRVRAVCQKQLPAWHGGSGKPAFLFIDEIVVK